MFVCVFICIYMCVVGIWYCQKLIRKRALLNWFLKIKPLCKYSEIENNLARINFRFMSSGKYSILN